MALPGQSMNIVCWRDFRLDLDTGALSRGGAQIRLKELESSILKLLVEAHGEVVLNERLFATLWPDRSVTVSSLAVLIHNVRKAVHPEGDLIILNVPRVGYRTGVHWVPVEMPPPVTEPGDTSTRQSVERTRRRFLAATGAAIGGVAIIASTESVKRKAQRAPRLIRIRPLTHDGLPKAGPVLSDGRRLYFNDTSLGTPAIMVSMPVGGGEAVPTRFPSLAKPRLSLILSPDGHVAVLGGPDRLGSAWAWQVGSQDVTPVPLDLRLTQAWEPKAPTIFECDVNGRLTMVRGRTAARRLDLPGIAGHGVWRPDGSGVRFQVVDAEVSSFGDVLVDQPSPRSVRVPKGGRLVENGGIFNQDGRYFLFVGTSAGHDDIWCVREQSDSTVSVPQRLTDGELNWESLTLGNNGTIHAIGSRSRTELTELDSTGRIRGSFLNGIPATEVDFSRDARFVVYTRHPENSLWISNSDGTSARRLTPPEFESHMGHFSPDGEQIAFMGQRGKGPWQVFIVPSRVGAVRAAAKSDQYQGVPTWSGDGSKLIYGERMDHTRIASMRLWLIDLGTGSIEEWPDSLGLWTARWSPDGRFICALSTDSKALVILDTVKKTRREIARLSFFQNPMWSADSSWIYSEVRDSEGDAVYRVQFDGSRLERVTDLRGFVAPADHWFGVTPKGAIIGAHTLYVQDIYALDCEFP